jgi:hypothetical protein
MIGGIAAKIADAAVAVSVVRTTASAPPDDRPLAANQAEKTHRRIAAVGSRR